ncbi:MAG: lytic murein transglycosylase [Candidatus Micrarchaeota archaeon]|nr:lytic murein transglycosylase [Candidatus Micrarchaeota archaeon]
MADGGVLKWEKPQQEFHQEQALPDKTKTAFTKIGFSEETISKVKKFLLEQGFEKKEVEKWLSDPRIEKLDYPPPIKEVAAKKKKKTAEEQEADYQKYKKDHDFWFLVQAGKLILKLYKETFEEAEKKTGVPKEFLAAVLGIESKFGQITGNYPVLNLYLTYLENRPDKEKFAKNELAAFLRFCKKYEVDPFSIKGSSAGALFPGQFLSSTLMSLDESKGASFDEVSSFEKSVFMAAEYLKKAGATKEEGYGVGGSNWKAAWRYNHDDRYARFVMELAQELKP